MALINLLPKKWSRKSRLFLIKKRVYYANVVLSSVGLGIMVVLFSVYMFYFQNVKALLVQEQKLNQTLSGLTTKEESAKMIGSYIRAYNVASTEVHANLYETLNNELASWTGLVSDIKANEGTLETAFSLANMTEVESLLAGVVQFSKTVRIKSLQNTSGKYLLTLVLTI